RNTVENWLHTLGQSLPKDELDSYPQRFLIMDNARFHRGGDLKQIAEKYNLTLLYLPPYSPELNPVEHKWAVVKQKVKLSINDFDSLHDCVKYCSV
ncbi:transposase, partial [Mycobacterium tuberculosis]|nr:transposase [Mycobacterium tuberculosis]